LAGTLIDAQPIGVDARTRGALL